MQTKDNCKQLSFYFPSRSGMDRPVACTVQSRRRNEIRFRIAVPGRVIPVVLRCSSGHVGLRWLITIQNDGRSDRLAGKNRAFVDWNTPAPWLELQYRWIPLRIPPLPDPLPGSL